MPAKPVNGSEPQQPRAAELFASWLSIEVDTAALTRNMRVFRKRVGPAAQLLAVVKADAYGHGLLLASTAFLEGGADWLGVHSVRELQHLRSGGVDAPVLVLGPVDTAEARYAADQGADITVGSLSAARAAVAADAALNIHLKVETGVNRQGIVEGELSELLAMVADAPQIRLVGLSSHFADIEDTTDHGFAEEQMARFDAYHRRLVEAGYVDLACHMSCSAAALLWDRSHRDIARVGISAYGVWPSRETLVSVRQRGRQELALEPALAWKCRISQIRQVPAGETVGYGRSWKAMADSRIAVLPVGYSDGWPRSLSGRAHVLVHGVRAPLVGRICMNLCMADVTGIPAAAAGDEAVLLGSQGDETISPEMLAGFMGTISYEVLTLPGPSWNRIDATSV